MFKNVLVPTDGSELSRKAVLYGVQLAKLTNARLTGLTISAPFQVLTVDMMSAAESQDQYRDQSEAHATKTLEQVKMACEAAGVPCDVFRVENDQPYRAIIDTATQQKCDVIVMASHGRRGVSALLLGSETSKVLTHSTIPVLVYR